MYSAERQSKGPWPKDMQTFRCPKPLSNCSRYDIADTSILRGKKLSHAMTAMSSMFSSLASPAKNDAHCAFCHCHTCQTSGNSYQSYGSPFTSDSIGSLIQEPKKIVFPWMALNNIKTSVISLTFSQHFRTCSSLLLSLVVGLALDVGPGWHCPNAWADAKRFGKLCCLPRKPHLDLIVAYWCHFCPLYFPGSASGKKFLPGHRP